MKDQRDPSEIYKQITGNIVIKRSEMAGVITNTATWAGGDVVGISGDFINAITNNEQDLNASKHGSYITICDFTVKIFDYHEPTDLYLAKKV